VHNPEVRPTTVTAPLIRLEGVSKSYGPVRANDRITMALHPNEVTAILGENGAGKSTLMAILAGKIHPDEGRIVLDGAERRFRSTREAIEHGIGMVYQHFTLVEAMTVAENVHLGREGGMLLDRKRMNARVRELGARYGWEVDPERRVFELSMGEKQQVEILKLLHRQSRVLIFDEPTAVLTPVETAQLFQGLRQMAGQSRAVVFISHKLKEVMEVADRVVILRRGAVVSEMRREEIHSTADLARAMVGRDVIFQLRKEGVPLGEPVLQAAGLEGEGFGPLEMTLHKGEILAVVGVAGNGQKPFVETVSGLVRPVRGRLLLLGREWAKFFGSRRFRRELSYIPEDRLGRGTCPNLTLKENFLMTTRDRFGRGGFLRKGMIDKEAGATIERYNVQPANADQQARRLSGGNLQKLVVGRELSRAPRLVVAEQPTQGLDISATQEVWDYLLQAKRGAGVLLVTGDLNEALKLADRIAVMYRGRFVDIFPITDKARVAAIGQMMAGVAS
jgi:general nucleoside transport system ATP-binding protein